MTLAIHSLQSAVKSCLPGFARLGVLLTMTLGAASVISADSVCDYKLRPPTAVEKKAYADAFALFQRMAPAAPDGWEATDSAKDNAYQSQICMPADQLVTSFTFSRSFKRIEGMEQRNAEVMQKTEAMAQKSQDLQKANETKLAAIRQQEQDLALKMVALVQANKLNEVEPLNARIEKLQEEEKKLMGVEESDAESKVIEAFATKDTYAMFSVAVDADPSLSSAFKPMAVAEGKGYRQDYDDDNGIPKSDLVLVLRPVTSGRGPTVVRVSGDRERAESLLKAVHLH